MINSWDNHMQILYTVQDDASHPRAGQVKKDTRLIELRTVQFKLGNFSFLELFKFQVNIEGLSD